jgi:UDP-glucose 4-epimerase
MAETVHFDAIVHLGTHVGWSGAAESEMFTPNILSTGCLAHLAKRWNAQLIFASAAIVHGARKEKIESSSPIFPDTDYARTKWLGEQLIMASQAHYCVLRIAGVFGFGGPAHLAMNNALNAAFRGETPTMVGHGRATRNYIYVKDVAHAIEHALRLNLEGTHLLAGNEVLSIGDMLRAICDEFLPGARPLSKEGPEATDQVVDSSSVLPVSRGFREALADIRKEGGGR